MDAGARRLCLSASDTCTGLNPCNVCQRTIKTMALVPAILAFGEIARDQIRTYLATHCSVEAAEAFAATFAGATGFSTYETVRALLNTFDEGWERCRLLA